MAESKLLHVMRNISYTFMSNVIHLLISTVTVLIIPKFVGVETYGYYQLYLFYISYAGVAYFGWCEGIYLREGGKYYSELDKGQYSAQFRLLGLLEVIIYTVIYAASLCLIADGNKHFVIGSTSVVAVGMCLRWFITFILQATARIKEYATVTISERIIFVVLVLGLLLAGYRQLYLIVVADVAAKYISLFIGMWCCQDIVKARPVPVRAAVPEIRANMSVGLKLMFSSLCSMLIIGVIRFGVETCWDIATFSKVSLTLSVSNLVMTAINAVAVVLYPMLRRTSGQQLPRLYGIMRVTLMGLILGGMIFYYPIKRLLSAWLPQYAESLQYAAILFPICVYESKMSMLINTYYKALRLEKQLMRCNIAALVLSGVLTVLSTVVLHNVTAAIISILICLVFRGIIGELILSKHIAIEVKKDIVIELCMTVAFIVCNWFFGSAGMVMYAGCYVLYLLIKKNDIKETVSFVKSMR